MQKSQEKLKKIADKLPDTPGVYKFIGERNKLLYIGKATSLRSRVRSYFSKDLEEKRSPLLAKMVEEARNIKFEKTDSVLEALILEAELIKKFLPPYNSTGKDQKSWNYVVVTEEKFPRVLVVREREITPLTLRGEPKTKFGPFTSGKQLKEALKIVRKIFPFRDRCNPNTKPCFNYQIGLCPGVCAGKVSEKDYKKTIRHIVQFFEGRKTKIIKELEKEMRNLSNERKFEEADSVKRKIFALKHIQDIALIRDTSKDERVTGFRIEAYDIAHISGKNMVGVMTVVEDGEANKSQYRMFKIKNQSGANDTKALEEILERRLRHLEWPLPNLLVVDGSIAQMNIAKKVLGNKKIETALVAVTKDERHKPVKIQISNLKSQKLADEYEKEILLANSEAHRFAISFHRHLRDKIK